MWIWRKAILVLEERQRKGLGRGLQGVGLDFEQHNLAADIAVLFGS